MSEANRIAQQLDARAHLGDGDGALAEVKSRGVAMSESDRIAAIRNEATTWLQCAKGQTPGWANPSPSKPIDLVERLLDRLVAVERAHDAMYARAAQAESVLLTLQRQVRLVIPGLVSEIRAAAKYREGMLSAQIEPLPEWADRLAALLLSLAEKDNTS